MREVPATLEEIQEALTRCRGNKSAVARELGIRRTNLVDRINSHPELILHAGELVDEVIDRAEQNVFEGVFDGADVVRQDQASRYILSTLGKNRGYSTRQEATGANGAPIPIGDININFVSPSAPALENGGPQPELEEKSE